MRIRVGRMATITAEPPRVRAELDVDGRRLAATAAPVTPARPVPTGAVYEAYTLDRYHRSIHALVALKWRYAAWIVTLTALTVALFSGVRTPASELGQYFQYLTLVWLLPIPLLIWVTIVYFAWFREAKFRIEPPAEVPPPAERPTVQFQVTSTGVNVETVLTTIRSVLYWTGQHPEVGYRTEIWATIEEFGYRPNQERFDALAREGVHVVVVPMGYRPPNGTTRKGRALQYAVEQRRALGPALARTWIYHQDDETAVGEDTVLGIDEFVRRHGDEKALGLGIILYPQDADFRPSQIQEFGRTKDDLRTVYTITSPRNKMSGFHGSHYVVRADVEDATGWDVGPNMLSEDLIFENAVRREHGAIFHILKGFAYEKAAFSLADQLRQRRRWVQGFARAIRRERFSWGRRAVMAYSMGVWLGAFMSLGAIATSWIFGFTPLLPFAGGCAGFVWVSMISGYHKGYILHREYLPPRSTPLWRVVVNGVVGALTDGAAPWYGLLSRRTRGFEVIQKDRSTAPIRTPARGVAGVDRMTLNR